MKIPKSAIFTAVLTAALIVSSCYQPLTELLIAAIEDDYSPVIVVDSPINGDTYYSTIDVTGHINDDSISPGDNRGLLRSISFIVSNDLDHKGKVDLDTEGNTAKDSSFGNLDIIYDNSNRSFSFSVPTSDLGYPPQTLYVLISVVDFNENETTEVIQLIRSEGPFIDMSQPITNGFVLDETITIQGTVSDSIRRLDQAGEVATIKLEILALGISAELDVAGGETSVPLITRAGAFDYDPGLRTFQAFLFMDSTSTFDANILTMVFNLHATDLTDNVTTISHTMNQIPDQGPTLNISSPRLTGTYYYSGSAPASPILWVDGTTRIASSSLTVGGSMFYPFSSRRIATADLQFGAGTIDLKSHGGTVHYGPDEDPLTGYWYPFDYYFYNVVYSESTIRSFINDGNVNLTLTAIDNTPDLRTSVQSWPFKEDSTGPLFSLETAGTDSGNSYVGDTHTVSLSFRINDGAFETGVDLASLAGTVGGIPYITSDFGVTEVSSGVYDITLDIPVSTPLTQSAGTLQISISADDYIGNPALPLQQGDFDQLITYVPGTPSLNSVSIAADEAPANAAKPDDWITLTVNADQDLDPTALDVTIAGISADISGSGSTLTAKAQIPSIYAPDTVEFSVNAFKNMVGVSGTVPSDISTIQTGSNVTVYDEAPSLTTRTVSAGGDRYAASSETITVSITSDQPLDYGPTVDIGGNVVVAVGSGTSWTATTQDPTDGEGSVSLEFSDIVNIVGEPSSPATVSGVTSGLGVVYYPGKPTITIDKFDFENVGGGSGPNEDDLIVLEFSVDNDRELLGDPTVVVSSSPDIGITFGMDQDSGDFSYRYEYPLTVGDIGTGSVDFSVAVSSYSDAAGTAGDSVNDNFTFTL